jgi:NitT/TauT family transport system permease protein
VPPAIGIVYSRIFAKVAYTFIVPLQTIPSVALAPLIVLWSGYGLLPKLLVACLISFFPIVIASVVGFRAIEQEMLYLARSLNASEWQIFLKFRLPRTRPLRASQRTSLQSSPTQPLQRVQGRDRPGRHRRRGRRVHRCGERAGLPADRVQTSLLFGSVAVISLVGLFALLVALERLAMPWYRPAEPAGLGA